MLPRKVQIGGHVFKIVQSPRSGLPRDSLADVDPDKCVIRLYGRTPPSRKIECVIHESLHAMLAGHEFEDEEEVVRLLGDALTQFIKDNPVFIRHALKVL